MYQSYAPMTMVAFAMRKYVDKIYDTNGKPRKAKHLVDDVVEMFAAWEKGKQSNKLNFMFESREAGKLSRSLIQMFSLKKLKGYSDISSLKDAKAAIQYEYTKEKGFPLWSLKYCPSEYNTEDMRTLITNVMQVVSDPESMKNPTLLNDTINGFEAQKFEWLSLLSENEGRNYEDGFNAFIKNVEIANVQDAEIGAVMEYLRGHLPGEIGLWKESDVKENVKDWRMLQQQKTPQQTPAFTPSTPIPYPQPPVDPNPYVHIPTIEDVSKKRNKLKESLRFMPSQEAKDLLEEIIDKESVSILDILLKYV